MPPTAVGPMMWALLDPPLAEALVGCTHPPTPPAPNLEPTGNACHLGFQEGLGPWAFLSQMTRRTEPGLESVGKGLAPPGSSLGLEAGGKCLEQDGGPLAPRAKMIRKDHIASWLRMHHAEGLRG